MTKSQHTNRFGVMAGVTPQKVKYKFAMYQPASIVVSPATSCSCLHVVCKRKNIAYNTTEIRALYVNIKFKSITKMDLTKIQK